MERADRRRRGGAVPEGDLRLHLLREADAREGDDDAVRGERERPDELRLELRDVLLRVEDGLDRRLPRRGEAARHRLVVLDPRDHARPRDQVVGADRVRDEVARDPLRGVPVPQPRAAGEVRVRRVDLRRRDGAEERSRCRPDELAGADRRLAGRDGVVDVVGRLRGRVVVERHPGHVPDGLRRDERPVVRRRRRVDAEPALRGAVPVRVHSRPARVVDPDGDRLAFGDRARRRDHQLVRRALQAVLRGVAHLR